MQVSKTHLHDLGKPHSLGYLCLDPTVYVVYVEWAVWQERVDRSIWWSQGLIIELRASLAFSGE